MLGSNKYGEMIIIRFVINFVGTLNILQMDLYTLQMEDISKFAVKTREIVVDATIQFIQKCTNAMFPTKTTPFISRRNLFMTSRICRQEKFANTPYEVT